MTDSPIQTHRDGAILQVTLDRPKANAIDLKTSRLMGEVFAGFRDDPDLRVAIITGGGDKFFCPGWDLKAASDGDAVDGDYGVGGFGGLQELRGLNKPVIAAVNGIACGGGLEYALSADMILAADHATFALPEIRSGTCGGCGFDQLLDRAWELARLLASGPPLVYAAIKEIVRDAEDAKFQDAMNRITKRQLPSVDVLYSSEDQMEGARAFAEKRDPVWKGK
ncbi:Carnitinyl-CoA dehydratase [Nymphon striatum]|nr:Carnitinyl-CoA dehydratase [Nymphon striatum]